MGKSSLSGSEKKIMSSSYPSPVVPLLMLPDTNNNNSAPKFIHAFNDTVYDLMLPQARGKRCCGFSHGWLIMVDKNSLLTLLNPLTRLEIQLPRLLSLKSLFKSFKEKTLSGGSCENNSINSITNTSALKIHVHKVVLSDENPDRCIAMAIHGELRKLAFCKLGDRTWTIIEDSKSFYDDVIYYKKCFFAVDEYGGVVKCNLAPAAPTLTEVTPPWFFRGNKIYLVGTPRGLLMAIRYIDKCPNSVYRTKRFEVYMLDELDYKWFRVRELGEWMLFLGQNQSVALSARLCRGNCIYFTDDYLERHMEGVVGGHDVGIFNMDDQSVEVFLPCPEGNSKSISPTPTWVILKSPKLPCSL